MQLELPAWYCARTKAKQEHIAAANARKTLGLEVFHPRFRVERATRRGLVRVMESVFPCYIFVRCLIGQSFSDLQRAKGISSLVHFGSGIPAVEDSVIRELQECFGTKEPVQVREGLLAGDEVTVGAGAFAGMRAHVLREMPARRRVQILLDILGGPTPVDMDRGSVLSERSQAAGRVPILARG